MIGRPGTAATRRVWVYPGGSEETRLEFLTGGSAGQVGASPASTSPGRVRGTFGTHVLPSVVGEAAMISGPVAMATRRYFAGGEISASRFSGSAWALDDWAYTKEGGTLKQIKALDALLALPDVEGLRLDRSE